MGNFSMAGLTKARKLMLIIGISFTFFLAEIAVGFYTRSLALVADAFHYLNDLVGFVVALTTWNAADRDDAPPSLSFGWQRATLLGAFFNGVFLLALGVSIFLQAIERFVSLQPVENPFLVMIIGCVGFALNVISATILHEHDHDAQEAAGVPQSARLELPVPSGPAATEIAGAHDNHHHETNDLSTGGKEGVIIAGAVIWKISSPDRYYADPAVSMAIAFMIFFSSIPLVRKSGVILLGSAPSGVNPQDIRHDIEELDGVLAVHELHVWRLNQQKTLASAHITVSVTQLSDFQKLAKTVTECFHAYGIHGVTLQPELAPPRSLL